MFTDVIISIALLCVNPIQKKQLQCQQYYIECLKEINDLPKCILKRKNNESI